jgi:hypothetical protein
MDNKPQKYKETERFSIRRLTFWLSIAGIVHFASVWDPPGLTISVVVCLMTLIAKALSKHKEKTKSDPRD